jgi:hypothetical protein
MKIVPLACLVVRDMELIANLAHQLEAAWAELGGDRAGWPERAARALADARPCDHLTMAALATWAVTTEPLPPQLDPSGNFGQPPITLYRGEHFVIDALCWLGASLAIHQHAFSGAFHVLEGSSLHAIYRFAETSRLSDTMQLGALTRERVEHLARGDTRPIRSGAGLIHSLFHLARPSVTIVVRTIRDPDAPPQLEYRAPGLALLGTELLGPAGQLLVQRLRVIDALHAADPPAAFALLRALLARCDAETWFRAVDRALISGWLAPAQLAQLRADARPGAPIDAFHQVFEETLRLSSLERHRAAVRDPGQRDFLALLLHLSGRRTILAAVAARYPGDPVETVMAWITALLGHRPAGPAGPNVLELELDEPALVILRGLLEGLAWDAILDRLRAEFDDVDAQRDQLAGLAAALRASRVFRNLLAEEVAPPARATRARLPESR